MLFDTDKNIICEYNAWHMEKSGLCRDTFCCPRCYEIVCKDYKDLQKLAAKCKCISPFKDGITIINKTNFINAYKKVLENMAYISKNLQHLDFRVTDAKRILEDHATVILYQESDKPLGYIAFIPYVKNNYDTFLITDFMVITPKQRQGIGKKLYDFMLNETKKTTEELIFDMPSENTFKFINKYFGIKTLKGIHYK